MEGKGACALKITSTGLFEGRAEGEQCAWMIEWLERKRTGGRRRRKEREWEGWRESGCA